MQTRRIEYDDSTVRHFILASMVFGIVGMLVGVVVACQLAWPQLNFGVPYLTFSRLRPLHTNAVIFAFVGNMLFAGIYYSTQRLLKARMWSDRLSAIHFWGWQAIIVAAAITLPLGLTSSKEYAELEWPIDLAITVVWVLFGINFFVTLARRNERQLYVAIWFYISTIVTVAVLHVVNSLALPLTAFKSYSAFAGVQDALVQWWYGHNAVAFFLTTPILGIMYYFLPKAADRPVYSYRLSVIHFWALVFMYIWAGPHHLLNTALPDWAQSLGMVFSIMLWAPSWGGMLNGLLTLRGAWDKVRQEPVLKFFVGGLTFYGMATLEGPLLSIKSVSALAHYTDWIVGHVHAGALGWNGFMAAGMFYWLVPRLYGTKLRSTKAAEVHFWLGTLGIVLYVVAMWVSAANQGLMWRALNPDGTLVYPSWVESLIAIRPMYIVRGLGGTMYLAGFLLMAWNLWATVRQGRAVNGVADVVVEDAPEKGPGIGVVLAGRPLWFSALGFALATAFAVAKPLVAVGFVVAMLVLGEVIWVLVRRERAAAAGSSFVSWFNLIERRPFAFTIFTLIAVLVGGVAELLPTIFARQAVPMTAGVQKPYTALELQGRDLYVREGCYTCHSQMVRPLMADAARFGEPSRAEEFIYDRPFQWGSKRTGPDLHRIGGRYPNLWHYTHLIDPRATSPGSNMPAYPWLATGTINVKLGAKKLALMQKLGVPYTNLQVDVADLDQKNQALTVVEELAQQHVELRWDSEMVAMIAYLQRLGRDTGVPGTWPMSPPAPVAALPASQSQTVPASPVTLSEPGGK
jgi:cytochrome c oxidase cbb3-type subunit I/II